MSKKSSNNVNSLNVLEGEVSINVDYSEAFLALVIANGDNVQHVCMRLLSEVVDQYFAEFN